jgi:pimeloyl-ACP methyl ester carboxylesterase
MSTLEKPGRRAVVKWVLASTGLPIVSQALGAVAEGRAKPEDSGPPGSSVTLSSGAQIYYQEDWFGEPWLDPEPAVFLHGDLEKGEIWYGWVPRMGQHYRLFRLDLPGFGRSTVPANFEWSLPNLGRALGSFLDAVGVASAHIIGAKTGGALAMYFAATNPQRVRTLVVASGPFSSVDPKMASSSQRVRLGSAASKEEMDYFDKLRDEASAETKRAVQTMNSSFNLDSLLPQISAPTLIITSDRSALQSVETVLRSQTKIPHSRLLVLTSDAYHVAVAKADECVSNVLAFIQETKKQA